MKNKPQVMEQQNQTRIPDWLWSFQEIQEDDFLMGKTPQDLPDTWEEEE